MQSLEARKADRAKRKELEAQGLIENNGELVQVGEGVKEEANDGDNKADASANNEGGSGWNQ